MNEVQAAALLVLQTDASFWSACTQLAYLLLIPVLFLIGPGVMVHLSFGIGVLTLFQIGRIRRRLRLSLLLWLSGSRSPGLAGFGFAVRIRFLCALVGMLPRALF